MDDVSTRVQHMLVLGKVIDIISEYSGIVMGWIILSVAFINGYEIIMRKIFNNPTIWVQDVSIYILIWFAFVAAGYTWKEKKHIRVDVLQDAFSCSAQIIMQVAINFLVLVYILILTIKGWELVKTSFTIGQVTSNVLHFPIWLIQLGVVLGSFILLLQLIKDIINDTYTLSITSIKSSDFYPALLFIVLIVLSLWAMSVNPILGVVLLLLSLLLSGMPVFAVLGLVGTAGFFILFGGVQSLVQVPFIGFKSMNQFVLLCVPLFILGGGLMLRGGLAEEVFELCNKWIGHLPGGLAVASILACAVFAAITGTSVATTITVGMIALPLMLEKNYDRKLAMGCLAVGGTLGILIPPSAPMVVYSVITDESVGALFVAGVIPGILLTFMLCFYVVIRSRRTGSYMQDRFSLGEKLQALKKGIWGLLTPVIILGGIYTGIFTPTEAAAVFVLYAFFVSILRKRLKIGDLSKAVLEGTVASSMILVIIAGAMIMGAVVTQLQIPAMVIEAVTGAGLSNWLILIAIALLLIILGMFLEVAAILLITVPVIYPLATSVGFDGVWFCIFAMILMQMALMTPPVGLNLFAIKGVAKDAAIGEVIQGAIPFVIILALFAVLLYFFPQLSTWLPGSMGYRY